MNARLLQRLGIDQPIIQAPMAGANASPPSLVAAVSNAGGMGFLGAAYMPPDQIERETREIRRLTAKPFGINLFAPTADPPATEIPSGLADLMRRYHEELGLEPPRLQPSPSAFDEQLDAAVNSGAAVLSFTFGLLPDSGLRLAKERGMIVVGTATTAREAELLEKAGVDAVVAQGSEAGAHRGTFDAPFELAMIGTMSLVPLIVETVRIPVIASGGIMNGRGIHAALTLGAQAAQMGTAFLVTDECGIAESYKRAIVASRAEETRLTRAFSGRPARGIINRAMTEIESTNDVLPYPAQNTLTRAMRTAAAKLDRPEFLSLWAGQGAHLARRMPAERLMRTLIEELEAAAPSAKAGGTITTRR